MIGLAVAAWLIVAAAVCACIGMLAAITYAIRHHLVMLATSRKVAAQNPGKMRGNNTTQPGIAKHDSENTVKTSISMRGIL